MSKKASDVERGDMFSPAMVVRAVLARAPSVVLMVQPRLGMDPVVSTYEPEQETGFVDPQPCRNCGYVDRGDVN